MFGCTYICTCKCLQNVAKICTNIYLHTCTPPPSHSHLLKLPRTVARVFSGWGIEWKNMDDKEPPARQWIWKKEIKVSLKQPMLLMMMLMMLIIRRSAYASDDVGPEALSLVCRGKRRIKERRRQIFPKYFWSISEYYPKTIGDIFGLGLINLTYKCELFYIFALNQMSKWYEKKSEYLLFEIPIQKRLACGN